MLEYVIILYYIYYFIKIILDGMSAVIDFVSEETDKKINIFLLDAIMTKKLTDLDILKLSKLLPIYPQLGSFLENIVLPETLMYLLNSKNITRSSLWKLKDLDEIISNVFKFILLNSLTLVGRF